MKKTVIMKSLYSLAAVFLWSMLACGAAVASTYYVRPDGTDTNLGTANSPTCAWQTIQHAADSVQPGDTVLIQEGNYPEVVFIHVPGTSTARITFRGEGSVTIQGMNFQMGAYNNSAWPPAIAYYTTFEHLDFIGPDPGYAGVYLRGVGEITFDGCIFENLTNGMGFDRNYYTNTWNVTVRNSIFRNNGSGCNVISAEGGLQNSTFENNTFTGNDVGFNVPAYGMMYNTFTGCTFKNNRIGMVTGGIYWYWLKSGYNTISRSVFNNNGTGLVIGCDGAANSYNCVSYATTVVNSDFIANTGSGIVVNTNFSGVNDSSAAYYDSLGQKFVNNIFLNNGGYGLDNGVNQTITLSHNLAFGNSLGAGHNAIFDDSTVSLVADPSLIDAANGAFGLNPNSPCIDAGDPAYDSDVLRSGSHVDIGAYEFSHPVITAAAEEHGTISPSGAITVQYGASQSFTLSPDEGYHVSGVSVDGASAGVSSAYTFSYVTSSHTITASFAVNTYTISAATTSFGNGTIAPSGNLTVNYGGTGTFSITPNPGYYVADVLVDGVSVGAVTSYTFSNVTANHTISATFARYINVLSPNGGETWRRGQTYAIRWAYTGNAGTAVTIELLRGGTSIQTIAANVPIGSNGVGAYGWKITGSQATGSNFVIRVTSTSNSSATDMSNASFTIR